MGASLAGDCIGVTRSWLMCADRVGWTPDSGSRLGAGSRLGLLRLDSRLGPGVCLGQAVYSGCLD